MRARYVFLALLFIAAAAPASAATEDRAYVIHLDASAAVGRTDAIGAELAATYGGTVEPSRSATGETVVLRLTPAKARALGYDPRVKSVTPLRARANAVVEPVNWAAGVAITYDGAADIVRMGNDEFLNDDVGRLVQAKINGATRDYTYDAFGNRRNCAQTNPSSACQFGYGINSNDNHLTGDVAYDPAGSGKVTALGPHRYEYDGWDMMTRDRIGTSSTTEFLYSADDERIATHNVSGGSWQWTVRDVDDKVLREFTSTDGGAWQWTKDYVWRDDKLLASLQPEDDVVTRYHYHLDHLGSPRRITDDDDDIVGFHDYYAFGPEVSGGLREPSRTDLKYTGHERDGESEPYGLDYMHARFYDASLGRFLSLDPAFDLKQTIPNPQGWNRYAYVRDNPLRYVDPDGRLDYDARLLGQRIHVHIDDSLTARRQGQLQTQVNASLRKINNGRNLTPAEKTIIKNIRSIDVDNSAQRSSVMESTGALTLTADYVRDSSSSWLGSAIAHDGKHVDLFNQGGTSSSRGLPAEVTAMRFQLQVGRKIGLSRSERQYIQNLIAHPEQLRAYVNSQP
ncbi:MAG TPA: RHS repeat-associated core domain-containing protein [Thermoanaerobaculia bacterium]|jgi:RHS repeat-associated protein|nr:RHS repeat-associated core domain-containing protein [Thermoanaerobaculia bacterium]